MSDDDEEVHALAEDEDVVLGVPLASPASPSAPSSASASASFLSARGTLSQRASHARSLVLSAQAFVVFGGYVRLRESAREWRMKTWYCALLRAQVYVYPTQRDASRATNLVKRVTVVDAQRSDGQGRLRVYKHAFTFRTASGAEFFCSAPSPREQELWIEHLSQAALAAALEDARADVRSNGSLHSSNAGDEDDDDKEPSLKTVSSGDSATFSGSSASASSSSASSSQCFTCGTAFGLLRRHRHTCRSCARHFCRAHCSQFAAGVVATECLASSLSTSLAPSSSSSSSGSSYMASRSRVCDACARRQHFISFLETFTATAIRLIRHDNVNVSVAAAAPPTPQSESDRNAKMRKELAIVVASPSSYTVLNVLCLLKKYVRVPWMFTRSLCMLIPLYERNPSSLEEYWTQFLIIFAPLLELREPFSPSMQFFLRFVSAVCRRSNAFALRTVWECLAFSEDARLRGDHMTWNYLMLLMIACSSFDGGSTYMLSKLFTDAPRAQIEAISKSLQEFVGVRSVLRDEIPKSLPARWFNALCNHETELSGQLVLAAADGIDDADTLLDVFDPSQTEYLAILKDRSIELPIGAEFDDECNLEEEDDALMAQKEREFDAQAKFVEQLTAISESLRHVQPVEKRTETLIELLRALDLQHLARGESDGVFVHAPMLSAGGGTMLDKLKLLRVIPEEGKVFSTRSRAPTMMVFEACPVKDPRRASVPMRASIIQGIPVSPEEEDDLLESELVMSAQLVSMRLRSNSRAVLGQKESVMLDALLCGHKDDESPSGSGSGTSDADDTPSSGNGSNSEDSGSPPDELLVQEARETYEDSAVASFLASFRGGESSAERSKWKRGLRNKSPYRNVKGWTVVSLIAKSHDDLRQEVFAMQLMRNLVEIFENNDLKRLYLRPYEILCTGANVGLIETLTNSQSVDSVKKQNGSLAEYFATLFGSPANPRYQAAQEAFITSMAASSLYCYFFQIKDRHNGNIMLDQRGHIMHIDFGFMMGLAPGGAFSLEDAPFKLTKEMVDIMGGLNSRGYRDFVELFTEGFLAVRREYIKIVTLLHLTAQDSPYPCFQNVAPHQVLESFRQRLFLKDGDDVALSKIRRLVDKSYNHWGTRQYDRFQYSSNGIMP